MKNRLLFVPLLLSCALACNSNPKVDPCEEAVTLIGECTDTTATYPPEGCVGVFAEQADAIVEGGCAGLQDDKSDFWCNDFVSWLGRCTQESLEEVAAIDTLSEVCPLATRSDALCNALWNAEDLAVDAAAGGDRASARSALSAAIAEGQSLYAQDANAARQDAAYRFLVRERALSLFVYNVLTASDSQAPPADYSEAAQGLISEHYPGYPDGRFPFALVDLAPPGPSSCDTPQGLLFFPGVVRLGERDEFSEQGAAIEAALPCIHARRVETGSFVEPSLNADQADVAVAGLTAEFGEIPLHTLGYSQGATNSLTTLVNKPAIATRVRTAITMNSAAHGSEVADLGQQVLDPLVTGVEDFCESLDSIMVPICESAFSVSPVPADWILELVAGGMGVPLASLQSFIEAEDGVSAAPDLRRFFERHLPGIASLSTAEAAEFWDKRAGERPRTTLYYSFRSVISDTDANLPASNQLFHSLLERAGGDRPFNDMQVRLDNQKLGGPIADLEIIGPLAEGNHWQWELATGAVPEETMPAEMTDRIPHRELLVGYYQAVIELGAHR